jgi:predicted ATPase/DNA-binding SARP family transcriptional activator
MSGLKLWLLGSPRLERDGAPLQVERRKAVALLAYLALTGEAHSREALATLFWPDYTQARAHANLRRTIWTLKDALGKEWVAAEQESFSLVRSPGLWLDVDEFRRLLLTGGTHDHPAHEVCSACLPHLSQAAKLYRDDFLAGFTLPDCPDFDEWQFFQREGLRRDLAGALERLARGHSSRSEFELAIPYARRWLALDPLHEPAHRQLMQLYVWTGQPAAALRQYHECVRVLGEELGVPPSAETTALYEAIKARRVSLPPAVTPGSKVAEVLEGRGETSSSGPPYPEPPNPPLLSSVSLPSVSPARFVARERELARLNEFLGITLTGQGQVVFLTGEAGSGKTALAREFARRAQQIHAELVVANGNCDALTGFSDPYLPFREVLSLLTGDIEARWAAGMISSENASRLWNLMPLSVPALVDLSPDLIGSFVPGPALLSRAVAFAPGSSTLPAAGGARGGKAGWLARLEQLVAHNRAGQGAVNLQQSNLFEQYTMLLQALAARRPLLLLLDDLHWADPSSISLLFHLGRRIGGSRILLVGTYRPEDVAVGWENAAHPLEGVVSEFKRDFGDIGVDLDQATRVEGRRFVEALLDAEPNRLGEEFREALFRHTGGHALFTVELLRDMQERGDLRRDAGGQWVAEPTPRPAGVPVQANQGGLDWKRLPARMEGVVEKRIARLPAELRQALRIASVEGEEFTAEVVARVLGVDEGEIIRRLSAEAVRQHRLVSAGSLQWLGQRPLSRYQFRHNLFQKYLYHTLDEVERAYLHEAVGSTLEALYGERTEQVAVQLARHFQAAGNVDKAADYLLQAGERARRLSAHKEAIGYFRQGLALLQALPDTPERARRELALQLPLGNALITIEGYAALEVGQAFSRARELCRQLGDTPELFPVLTGLHRFFLVQGKEQMGRELGEQLLNLAREGQDPGLLTEAHRALGVTLWYPGEFVTARSHFEQGIALYDRQRYTASVLYGEDPGVTCLSYAAWTLWILGYPDQALRRNHEALNLAQELAHPFSLASALAFAAGLHQFRGEGGAARERAEAAMTLSTEQGFPFWLAAGRIVQGWALVEQYPATSEGRRPEPVEGQGQAEGGVTQIRQGLSDWQAMGIEVGRTYYLALLAEAYGKVGQAEEGLSVLDRALAEMSSVGCWWEAELYRLKGELWLLVKAEAKVEVEVEVEAEVCFRRAIEIARQQVARSLELRAVMSLSRLWYSLRSQGKTGEARHMLAEVYGWFTEGFDTADLKDARALLEALA